MNNVTFNGYHLPTVARIARELHSPVDGELAWFVWRLSTANSLPYQTANEFLKAAGYLPFQGYPLKRGKGEQ